MTLQAEELLKLLKGCRERGAHSMACDGKAVRAAAHELESLNYAEWVGTSYGSSFYTITEHGLQYAR